MPRRERRPACAMPAPSWQACGSGRFMQRVGGGAGGLAERRTSRLTALTLRVGRVPGIP